MGSTVPVWVAVLLPLAPSLVAIAAIAAAEIRDRRRIEQEKNSRLRDERIEAYRKLLAATTTAHVDREGVAALSEAYAEISLLAGTKEIDRAAARVWTSYANTQKIAAKSQNPQNASSSSFFASYLRRAEAAREHFLELAREELQVEPSQGSTPGEALPGRQEPTSQLPRGSAG